MSTAALHTELLRDPVIEGLAAALGAALKELRFFRAHPYDSLFNHTRQYSAWHKCVLRTSRTFSRWILPVWQTSTARIVSVDIYGKLPAPVEGLGSHSASKFIRFLLYELQWEDHQVVHYLTNVIGYSERSARPLMRRMLRDTKRTHDLWLRERKNPDVLPLFKQVISTYKEKSNHARRTSKG